MHIHPYFQRITKIYLLVRLFFILNKIYNVKIGQICVKMFESGSTLAKYVRKLITK